MLVLTFMLRHTPDKSLSDLNLIKMICLIYVINQTKQMTSGKSFYGGNIKSQVMLVMCL